MAAEPSLMQRGLARFARVEPRESAAVIASFLLFFFVLGSYFSVRPVRETIATLLGRDRVADLWLYTAIFAIAIVPLYGWLVARVRRSLLLPWIYGVVAVILAVIGSYLSVDEDNLAVGTFFYVWISVLNLMLVSVFWSFLLEMFSSRPSDCSGSLLPAAPSARWSGPSPRGSSSTASATPACCTSAPRASSGRSSASACCSASGAGPAKRALRALSPRAPRAATRASVATRSPASPSS
jgi:hypothetical protein